jgi:hypothetical protein
LANRCVKTLRKEKCCETGADTTVERLKKIRALNCNPSDIGLDCYIWKSLFANARSNIVTKLF